MRLTLRTLLAYLDDTIDPKETKAIGEKIAESDLAGELIGRIKKVTRRRGISSPSVEGDNPTSDPNTVAEYLDNNLPADEVADLEKMALESDQILSEIAASHQILSLALAEPASVPPTANQRMYRLLKGRESQPFRKPVSRIVAGAQETEAIKNHESEFEFELPALATDRPRWGLLVGVSAVLLGVAGFAIYKALPSSEAAKPAGYAILDSVKDAETAKPKAIAEASEKKKVPEAAVSKKEAGVPKKEAVPEPNTDKATLAELLIMPREVRSEAAPKMEAEVPAPKPSLVRQPIGQLSNFGSFLISKAPKSEVVKIPREDVWHRVVKGNPTVQSSDQLVAPPGYHPEIELNTGVHLQLWGNLPEFLDLPLLETRATLHLPDPKLDADLTLQIGRIFIRNDKLDRPVKVRVRMSGEVWDFAIEPKSEIGLDRVEQYLPGVSYSRQSLNEPKSLVALGVLSGRASVRVGFKSFPEMNANAMIQWDNKGGGLQEPILAPEKKMAEWSRDLVSKVPGAAESIAALADIEKRIQSDAEPIDVDWASIWKGANERPSRRIIALFGLESIDATTDMIDALGDDLWPLRRAAAIALRHWSGGARERDRELYDTLVDKRRFSGPQAEIILELLHTYSFEETQKAATYEKLFNYLKDEKIQIRELAFWHLIQLDPQGDRDSGGLDTGGSDNNREAAWTKWYNSWRKRFDAKKTKK